MCGIAGIADFEGRPAPAGVVSDGLRLLAHRGPDGHGVWTEGGGDTSVCLGHRRLAVLDLSGAAAQPMHNTACVDAGRASALTLVFNGEIYNFVGLRQELLARGHRFVSHSDSEVLLHLYEESGPDMLERLRGMFALAIWDSAARRLFCARDRVGKKPFYYRYANGRFWFASEPRAILVDPDVPVEAEPDSIGAYLSLGYVPAERSAFRGLHRLLPGHSLTIDRQGLRQRRYWRLEYTPKEDVSMADALDAIRETLIESVRLRLVSDVPLGAFLSGGIDSSLVVALMCRAGIPVKTFSIGFDDPQYDELRYARMVADHYRTEHHEFVVRPDAASVAPTLAWHYGEPYADSSAVPTYYLSRLARQHITVALTGDGGDESFVGYRRYLAHLVARWYRKVPGALRVPLERAVAVLPVASSSHSRLYDAQRFINAASDSDHHRYASWFGFFSDLEAGHDGLRELQAAFESHRALHPIDAAMATDVSLYLPDDLLVKIDIAAMAHGLETRSPLLDHEVMELAARLPVSVKLRGLRPKSLLRALGSSLVPPAVLSRPKTGFGVPLDRWFRDDLVELVNDILLTSTARTHEHVSREAIGSLLADHRDGRAAHGHRLWALLMLEFWYRVCLVRPTRDDSAPGGMHPRLCEA